MHVGIIRGQVYVEKDGFYACMLDSLSGMRRKILLLTRAQSVMIHIRAVLAETNDPIHGEWRDRKKIMGKKSFFGRLNTNREKWGRHPGRSALFSHCFNDIFSL